MIINAAIQVLPRAKDKHPYEIVDAAIAAIRNSGMKYEVCPFETVVEGEYEDVMTLLKTIREKCFEAGAEDLLINLKLQMRNESGVSIEEKMHQYRK
ncbi:MAG TPA: thiamine-binding protein [Bacteroidia bacterium]|jgi:uncharacterized protein YqgV (UPF0045/DUF77 family)|nr:thiamine-binding protein [Bacteroidia bacterium]